MPDIECAHEKNNGGRDRGLPELSCNLVSTWAEPDRGILRLRKLECVGVGGLPIMDELEPLEKTRPFQYFQMAFVTIPVNP